MQSNTVAVRDHSMDFGGDSEIEFNDYSQMQQIPPFNIKKVDSINFFGNERNESSRGLSNQSYVE